MFSKIPLKAFVFWALSGVAFFIIFTILTDESKPVEAIKFSEFRESVAKGSIKSAEIKGLVINGTFTEEYVKAAESDKEKFSTVGPVEEDLQDLMLNQNVEFTFISQEANEIFEILRTAGPILLLIILIVVIMRQFQGGGGKAMSFGKSRAKLLNENTNKVTFADVAGIDEAKHELEEIIDFLKSPKKFTRLGGRIPKGVLLMGPPGTGKTLLARSVAGEADVPFFSISGSDFVEMFVGVGASRVRDLFEQAKTQAPCIIFIDEIDAVGRHRGSGMGGGHDEREQTLNQLLVEMDGFESNEGVILIAATNRADVLDPALLRPGRFDRRVVVSAPDVRGREQILKIHNRRTPMAKDVDLKVIARGTPGFSGADLENLVNEAALYAARQDKDRVEFSDFDQAKDKVMMGSERKSAKIGEKERAITAFHEAGHALVAMLQDGTDPVHKVTIIPRGRALGVTQQLPAEDAHIQSKEFALKYLAIMMGGRAAEMLVFDHITTGASSDIARATDLARSMVCDYGMSEKLGPVSYSSKSVNPFPGFGGGSQASTYSESVAQLIDSEIQRIITEQYDLAESLLRDRRDLLDLMADALLEFEVLDSKELALLVEFENLDSIRKHREILKMKEEEAKLERKPKTDFSSSAKDPSLTDLKPSHEF